MLRNPPPRTVPLAAERFQARICVVAPRPRVIPQTGEVRTDRNGRPEYTVSVSVTQEDGQDADMLKVVLAGEPPVITEGTPVTITGLTQNYWQMDERDGLTYRAEAVAPDNASPSGSSSSSAASGSASSSSSSGSGRGKSQSGDT
jgi:hypothetical protein